MFQLWMAGAGPAGVGEVGGEPALTVDFDEQLGQGHRGEEGHHRVPLGQSLRVDHVVHLELGPTVSLRGQVTMDGAPAPYPYLSLHNERSSSYHQKAANPDGTYLIVHPPGRHMVEVNATSSGPQGTDRAIGLLSDFALPPEGRTQDFDIPTAPFRVRVLDPEGRPVPGASVVLNSGDYRLGGSPVKLAPGLSGGATLMSIRQSGDDGWASGRMVPGAAEVQVGVDPPVGAGLSGASVTAPDDDGQVEVRLSRPSGATLRGVVRDVRGVAIPGVSVALFGADGRGGSAVTASDGSYSLASTVGPATLYLWVSDPFNAPSGIRRPGTWRFEAPVDLPREAVLDVTVPDATAVDVRVVGTNGEALPGRLNLNGTGDVRWPIALGVEAQEHVVLTLDGDGRFRSMLFGPAAVTGHYNPSPSSSAGAGAFSFVGRLAPNDHVVVALAHSLVSEPGVPGQVSAIRGDALATVSWSAPGDDGGSLVTSFDVLVYQGDQTAQARVVRVPGSATSAVITGLENGVPYVFSVAATNHVGTGPATRPSAPVTPVPSSPPNPPSTGQAPYRPDGGAGQSRSGYWMVGADGTVYAFGDARHLDNAPVGSAKAVDLEPTPSGNGYWVIDDQGHVFARGDATPLGNVDPKRLVPGEKVTSLSGTPSGSGYWVFTTKGRVLTFGDAQHFGDMSHVVLNGPVLDSIPTPSGNGYYMVASDGGIFAFGDARFAGSMGGMPLNAPVQSLVPDGDGAGYWLVASDGGVFAFDAGFRGSMGGKPLNRPVSGMVPFGSGYLMVGEDGGIFNFSDRAFLGSLGSNPPAQPIVSVAVLQGN